MISSRTAGIARRLSLAAVGLVAVVLGSTLAPLGATAEPGVDEISIVDGRTDAVFGYTDAIRERVFIPVSGVDQDLDGDDDVTAIDIIRPAATATGLKVPALVATSPYFTTAGRGNLPDKIEDVDGDGLNDVWPLFVDNYFVPRGYAVILAHMNGTGASTGCAMHGGPGDVASMRVVIDWLQGRVVGKDADGVEVVADWDNGRAAMFGKSYDGTLANFVAATGVEGLTTIVPIDAISDWYKYSRTNGVRHNTDYPGWLSGAVTNDDRQSLCAPARALLDELDGDESGDVNAFWAERNLLPDVDRITASVFAVQGLNDDNVRMDHLAEYWEALGANDVPRKLWLAKVGHVEPFDFRRDVWVDTLHRWFDHWLHGVPNGIMDEPMATVETDPGVFEDVADWPLPGTEPVAVSLTATEVGAPGSLVLDAGEGLEQLAFTGPIGSISENAAVDDPETARSTRLVFLSEPLEAPLRISGVPIMQLHASLDTTQANLAALLVDYGTATRTPRSNNGVFTGSGSSCWGESSEHDSACFREVELRSLTTDLWRVAKGALDSSNRDSIIEGEATPVEPGRSYDFGWPLQPYDHTFEVGHRIGVAVTTNLSGFGLDGSREPTVTVDTSASRIVLPVVGGLSAAADAVGLGAPAPVALSFELGGHGAAIDPQPVAYGTAPVEPDAPSEAGWVFDGWFADADRTIPFDFSAELEDDAIAYARWLAIEDVVATLEIEPSSASVQQGDTITVVVTGFDDGGDPLGDVTAFAALTSSVDTDEIVGPEITFVDASPHVITATLGEATASVSIWVEPAPVVEPAEIDSLGATGATVPVALVALAAVLAVLGVSALVLRRRLAS